MMLSAKVKSNLPSWGSIHAQAIGASTVLSPMLARFGHTAFMCSGLEAAVLVSSPARARNGLPSTMSWVAAPRFSRWATGGPVVVVVVGAHAVMRASATTSAKQARLRCCIIFAFRVIFSDALYYHSGDGMRRLEWLRCLPKARCFATKPCVARLRFPTGEVSVSARKGLEIRVFRGRRV